MKKFLLLLCLPCLLADEVNDEELAIRIEFDEFELEDLCVAKNNALVKFYNGTTHNLLEFLEVEMRTGSTLHNLNVGYNAHKTTNFSNTVLNRKLKTFSPGPALMGEDFSQFVKYAVQGAEARFRPTTEGKPSTLKEVHNIFRNENNASRLAGVWNEWASNLERQIGEFEPQLEKLVTEAEKNGFENVEKYWLHQSETTLVDYQKMTELWLSIAPLYQKLRQFVASAILSKFGKSVFVDTKLIPVHVLGSLDSKDWVTAVDKVDALQHSKSYSSVKQNLNLKLTKDMYKDADETTAELRLGYLPDLFFKSSQLEVESENCTHHVDSVCKTDREYSPGVLSCKGEPSSLAAYLRTHEEVARIKHLSLASNSDKDGKENGYLFREGLSDSALYEGIATASSLLAIHPETLHRRELLTSSQNEDANMTFLLVAALHIIPALPYHLAADTWRLDSLARQEETTVASSTTTTEDYLNVTSDTESTNSVEEEVATTDDRENNGDNKTESTHTLYTHTTEQTTKEIIKKKINLTAKWWDARAKYQGISSADGTLHADYLADDSILWNKPQVSKFLGPILLFQILERFKGENTTENLNLLQQVLRLGKSQPWETLVADLFNITEIRTEPILKYFKPLEAFLDGNANFKKGKTFAENDFRKLLLGVSTAGGTTEKGRYKQNIIIGICP